MKALAPIIRRSDDSVNRLQRNFYELLAGVYKVFSNANRLATIDLLSLGPRSFSDLMHSLRTNPNSVSRNLRVLQDLGLVEQQDQLYSITKHGKVIVEALFDEPREILLELVNFQTLRDRHLPKEYAPPILGEGLPPMEERKVMRHKSTT